MMINWFNALYINISDHLHNTVSIIIKGWGGGIRSKSPNKVAVMCLPVN